MFAIIIDLATNHWPVLAGVASGYFVRSLDPVARLRAGLAALTKRG